MLFDINYKLEHLGFYKICIFVASSSKEMIGAWAANASFARRHKPCMKMIYVAHIHYYVYSNLLSSMWWLAMTEHYSSVNNNVRFHSPFSYDKKER